MKPRESRKPEQRHDTIKSHHIDEHRHDPYKARGKLSEPSVCPRCSAAFMNGRWRWSREVFADAKSHICPACHRIADKYPAGELTLSGDFVAAHATEIIGLIRNIEAASRSEHPMQRLMGIEQKPDRIVVTTTDIHLPRRLGHALVDAYKGDVNTHYDEAGYFVRMAWRRDT